MLHDEAPEWARVVAGDSRVELLTAASRAISRGVRAEAIDVRSVSRAGETLISDLSGLGVVVVVRGALRVFADGQRRLVSAGEYITVDGRSTVRGEIVETSPDAPFIAVAVALDPDEICKVAAKLDAPSAATKAEPVASLDADLSGALARLVGAASTSRDGAVLVPIYRLEVLYRLMRGEHAHRLVVLARCRRTEQPLRRVLDYIDDHLADSISVADLATVAMLSPSSLSAQFAATIGRSPYQYVKDRRLERARELLRDHANDVASVARLVGYSSTSHFISQFRARFGVTPRSYAVQDRFGLSA